MLRKDFVFKIYFTAMYVLRVVTESIFLAVFAKAIAVC